MDDPEALNRGDMGTSIKKAGIISQAMIVGFSYFIEIFTVSPLNNRIGTFILTAQQPKRNICLKIILQFIR